MTHFPNKFLFSCATFLIAFYVCAGNLIAETLLLTGDRAGKLFQGGGEIKDISANGDFVLFGASLNTTPPAPGIPKDGLYLRKISEDTLTFVGDTTVANQDVLGAELSDDGNYIAWTGRNPATNKRQIYWRDIRTGVTRIITGGVDAGYGNPRLSADGRSVAFMSTANRVNSLISSSLNSLLPDNGRAAVYLYDTTTSITKLVSLSSTNGRLIGVGLSGDPFDHFDLSANGRFIVFASEDPNCHPDRIGQMGAGNFAVYRRDLLNGEVRLLNRNFSSFVADGLFVRPRISADGSRVIFLGGQSGRDGARKLISDLPVNPQFDVYVKDVEGFVWTLTRIFNEDPSLPPLSHGGGLNDQLAISDSGTVVVFTSASSNLIEDDDLGGFAGSTDIFKAEFLPFRNPQLSLVTQSVPLGNNVIIQRDRQQVTSLKVSGDGSYIAYHTLDFAKLGIATVLGENYLFPHSVGVGTIGLRYSEWKANLTLGQQGPNDNPSGDGVPNLLKFFVGSNASIADPSHLPTSGVAKGEDLGLSLDTQKYMTITVRIRRQLRQDYNWKVLTSTSLTGLVTSPVPGVRVGAPTRDDAFDIHLFRFPTPISASEKGFMRLNVSVPPGP